MKKFIKPAIVILILVGCFGLIAFALQSNKKKNEEATATVALENTSVAVKTDIVTQQTHELSFKANGNFEPFQELSFPAENSGRVVSVFADEGTMVHKGQTLAVIRTEQLSVDLQNANASYQNALMDMQRYENAYKTGGVTQQQVDQAKLKVSNTLAQVKQSQINIGNASIRATIKGIVNKRYIEPGSVVAPGTALFDIVNVSSLKLKVTVNEAQITGLKIGDSIKVTSSVFPDKEFTGKITFIAPKADNALNFPVEIQITNTAKNEIKAGMYGTAVFENSKPEPMLLVARTAFVGSVSNNQVFTVDKNNIAHLRKVTAGRIIDDKVEIVNGLTAGETIVTSGQINLADGAKITAVQ